MHASDILRMSEACRGNGVVLNLQQLVLSVTVTRQHIIRSIDVKCELLMNSCRMSIVHQLEQPCGERVCSGRSGKRNRMRSSSGKLPEGHTIEAISL